MKKPTDPFHQLPLLSHYPSPRSVLNKEKALPKIVNIGADEKPLSAPTEKELEAKIRELEKTRDEMRNERISGRANLSKADWRKLDEKTGAAYAEAIEAVNEAQKQLSRLKGRLNRKVSVGSAGGKEAAGKAG